MPVDLSIKKVTSIFDLAEQQLPVASWEIGGLKIWPLIRNNHWLHLISQKVFDPNNQIALNNNPGRQMKKVISSGISSIKTRRKNETLKKTDLLIAVTNSTRFFKINEAWYTPYSDSLIKHFKQEHIESLVLEFSSNGQCVLPRFSPALFLQHKSYMLSILARLCGTLNVPSMKESIEGWDDFLILIDNELGSDCRPYLKTVRIKARQILLHELWFKKILKIAQPKVVIIGFSYSSAEAMALIRACRALGILSIEIQHGVQGEEHIAYHQWANLPEQGYDTLPEIFWTWSETEKNNINSWAQFRPGAHKALVGGNPCLHIHGASDRKPVFNKTQELNIVFTAQAFDTLPEFFMEAMKKTPQWTWRIRLHPQYSKVQAPLEKLLREHNVKNAIITRSSEYPLKILLEHSDVHVTEYSSSVLEAKACGVASIVINPFGANLFKELIASDDLIYANTTESVISAVKLQQKKKNHEIKTPDDSCFFPDIMKEIKMRIHCNIQSEQLMGST